MKDQENPKIRLLMVDDEKEFLISSTPALGRRGIDVMTAYDGAMALKMIEENEFDAIVLDIKMPGIDGVEVFHRMKMLQPDLPIIMLTGHGSVPQAFETSKAGVFDYLSKPCDIDELVEVIRKAVTHADTPIESDGNKNIKPGVKIKLLIIDDEVDLLASLKNVLQRRGMEVITAQNGEEALKHIQAFLIDVVVLDVKMPGMDGLEVLERIKKESSNVEVILLTGHPTVDTALTGIKQGAFDYVVKPPDVDDLTDTIRKAYLQREENILERQQNMIKDIRERYPD
ncbi:response regulator [bacterium]|nr:response regulator [bacterium]